MKERNEKKKRRFGLSSSKTRESMLRSAISPLCFSLLKSTGEIRKEKRRERMSLQKN